MLTTHSINVMDNCCQVHFWRLLLANQNSCFNTLDQTDRELNIYNFECSLSMLKIFIQVNVSDLGLKF